MTDFVSKIIVPGEAEAPALRRHQGIPGVEVMPDGTLFVSYYAGTIPGEGPGNYAVVARSDDGGGTWREEIAVVPQAADGRVFDPVLWRTPDGELLLFYAQCRSSGLWDNFDGRAGVWVSSRGKNGWSKPRRLCDGVMMNKPEVLADGSWLLPVALWSLYPDKILPENADVSRPNLYRTCDRLETLEFIPGPQVENPSFDEHCVIGRRDGSWLMAVRTRSGAVTFTSADGGRHWSGPGRCFNSWADSRFALRRLRSGELILVTHDVPPVMPGEKRKPPRANLTVWLSEDDGVSWRGRLLLDSRLRVSYPDLAEGPDGFIYIVHDCNRIEGNGQVLLSRVTVSDIVSGNLITPGSYTGLLAAAFPYRPAKK